MKKILFTLLCSAISVMHATDNTQSLAAAVKAMSLTSSAAGAGAATTIPTAQALKKYTVITKFDRSFFNSRTPGKHYESNDLGVAYPVDKMTTFVEYNGQKYYHETITTTLPGSTRVTQTTNLNEKESTQNRWLAALISYKKAHIKEVDDHYEQQGRPPIFNPVYQELFSIYGQRADSRFFRATESVELPDLPQNMKAECYTLLDTKKPNELKDQLPRTREGIILQLQNTQAEMTSLKEELAVSKARFAQERAQREAEKTENDALKEELEALKALLAQQSTSTATAKS